MLFTDYQPGDVVYFPSGPFGGVCGVVRDVDTPRSRLVLDVKEGIVHREGGVLRERQHRLIAAFDEVEPA